MNSYHSASKDNNKYKEKKIIMLKRDEDDRLLSYSAQAMRLIYFSTSVNLPSVPRSPHKLFTYTTTSERSNYWFYMSVYIYISNFAFYKCHNKSIL